MGKAIKQEYVESDKVTTGRVWVSTVHLSVDHGYDGTPIWYETYIFAANPDADMVASWGELWGTRYSTEEEATAGHDAAMQMVKSGEWEPYDNVYTKTA